MQQFRVRGVGQPVFAGLRGFSHIEIVIGQAEVGRAADPGQQFAIPVDRRVEAGHVQLFGLRRQLLERQRFERADSGHDVEKAGQDSRPETRPLIGRAPVLFVAGAGQIVEEFLAGDARGILPDLLALDLPGDFGQGRKDGPDRPPVGSDRQIEVEEYLLDPHSIGVLKGPLQHGLGDLKADESPCKPPKRSGSSRPERHRIQTPSCCARRDRPHR